MANDLYFDENIPENLVRGLSIMQKSLKSTIVNFYLTKEVFGQQVEDAILLKSVSEKGDIFVTNDLRIMNQCRELIIKNRINIIYFDFASNTKYWEKVQFVIKSWELVLDKIKQSEYINFKVKSKSGKIIIQ